MATAVQKKRQCRQTLTPLIRPNWVVKHMSRHHHNRFMFKNSLPTRCVSLLGRFALFLLLWSAPLYNVGATCGDPLFRDDFERETLIGSNQSRQWELPGGNQNVNLHFDDSRGSSVLAIGGFKGPEWVRLRKVFQDMDHRLSFDVLVPGEPQQGKVATIGAGGRRIILKTNEIGGLEAQVDSDDACGPLITSIRKWHTLVLRHDRTTHMNELTIDSQTVCRFEGDATLDADFTIEAKQELHLDNFDIFKLHYDFSSDLDKDGVPDFQDDDRDGDGIQDEDDPFPFDSVLQFYEGWEKPVGLDRWLPFGPDEYLPQRVAKIGRHGSYALDTRGGAQNLSGAFSRKTFDLDERPTLTFWIRGESSGAYWQNLQVGWARSVKFNSQGLPSIREDLAGVTIAPENDREVIRYCVGESCYEEKWTDKDHHKYWLFFKIKINDGGIFSFYKNDEYVWTGRTKIPLERNAVLEIKGQSYTSNQLVDDIVVLNRHASNSSASASNAWRQWFDSNGSGEHFGVPMQTNCDGHAENDLPVQLGQFFTRKLIWEAPGQLNFEFMLSQGENDFAPAFFEGAHYNTSVDYPKRVKIFVRGDHLFVEHWSKGQYRKIGNLKHNFQSGIVYRCLLDLGEKVIQLSVDGEIVETNLAPPADPEVHLLPGSESNLLLWLPPRDSTYQGARIYRSIGDNLEPEKVVADQVTGMTWVDSDVIPGTKYSYSISSVGGKDRISRKTSVLTVSVPVKSIDQVAKFVPPIPDGKGGYRLPVNDKTIFSFPLQFESSATNNLFPDLTVARIYDPKTKGWDNADNIERGRGYFLQGSGQAVSIRGKEWPQEDVIIPVERGWNMVGNPFFASADLNDGYLIFDNQKISIQDAIKNGLIAGYWFPFLGGKAVPRPITRKRATVLPWQGFFLLSNEKGSLTLTP